MLIQGEEQSSHWVVDGLVHWSVLSGSVRQSTDQPAATWSTKTLTCQYPARCSLSVKLKARPQQTCLPDDHELVQVGRVHQTWCRKTEVSSNSVLFYRHYFKALNISCFHTWTMGNVWSFPAVWDAPGRTRSPEEPFWSVHSRCGSCVEQPEAEPDVYMLLWRSRCFVYSSSWLALITERSGISSSFQIGVFVRYFFQFHIRCVRNIINTSTRLLWVLLRCSCCILTWIWGLAGKVQEQLTRMFVFSHTAPPGSFRNTSEYSGLWL